MLLILSPSKDMKVVPGRVLQSTQSQFLEYSKTLVRLLRQMDKGELARLMTINQKLAEQNMLRFVQWDESHSGENAMPSILAFTGEAYRGLKASAFTTGDLEYAQSILRILSGLYGVLRPLDLVQEYRLEMGTKYPFAGKKNLYDFWCGLITETINAAINESPGEKVLINLASNEYYSSIKYKHLNYPVITPVFKQEKGGKLQIITVYAKKARGMMARFAIQNKLTFSEELKAFNEEGYYFDAACSTEKEWLFVR
jgi:uncharacterized protein